MARAPKPSGENGPPKEMPNVIPDVGGSGQTRILIDAVKETVAELKSDVKDIKEYRHTDFRWHITIFGSGFLLLAGLALHLYSRLEDKIQVLSTMSTRLETKVDSLARAPSPEAATRALPSEAAPPPKK
jgi:hypothetical protein